MMMMMMMIVMRLRPHQVSQPAPIHVWRLSNLYPFCYAHAPDGQELPKELLEPLGERVSSLPSAAPSPAATPACCRRCMCRWTNLTPEVESIKSESQGPSIQAYLTILHACVSEKRKTIPHKEAVIYRGVERRNLHLCAQCQPLRVSATFRIHEALGPPRGLRAPPPPRSRRARIKGRSPRGDRRPRGKYTQGFPGCCYMRVPR